MRKSFKVMVLSAITAMAFTLPLAAQTAPDTAPAGGPTSNLRQATVELYKTDVDNYLNVNNWSAVNFEKWFGFIHGTATRANLGYATNLGGIYVGARYWGNVLQETNAAQTVTLNPTYDPDSQELTGLTETTYYPGKYQTSSNQIDVLFGVAGHGIRVGFFESLAVNSLDGNGTFTKVDNQNGLITYTNQPVEYSIINGYLRPSVQWGTQLKLNEDGLTIKPRATLSFNIFQDSQINKTRTYTTFNGTPTADLTVNNAAGRNFGYLQPGVSIGADIALPKKDNVGTTFTIDYTLNLNIYNNDYSGGVFSGTAEGPVSWAAGTTQTSTSLASRTTTRTQTLTFGGGDGDNNYSSYMYHNIAPRIMLDKTVNDSLKFGLAVLLPVSITSFSKDRYTEARSYTETRNFNAVNSAAAKTVTETTVYTPLGLTETTTFTVSPSVRIGASYNLIPSRFTVNAGVRLDPVAWTYTTVKRSRNGDGVRTTGTTKNGDGVVTSRTDSTVFQGAGGTYTDFSSVNNYWTPFSGVVAGGFLFNFNENVALDLLGTATGFNLNLTTVNVMLTFKY